MTSSRTISKLLLVAFTTTLLAACGSDSNGGPGPNGASGQTFRGEITSLDGGLTVNGVKFSAAGARLSLLDETTGPVTLTSDAQLKSYLVPGMIVTVQGKTGTAGALSGESEGEAGEIEFEHELEGEIERHGAGEVEVHGHHVSIDDDTTIVDRHGDKLTKDDLTTGTRIEVSGHGDARGGVSATMVRVRDDRSSEDSEVKAWVVAVAGAVLDLSFTKGGTVAMQVDVSGVTPAPVVAVGDFLEVKLSGAKTASGAYVAVRVQHEDSHGEHHEGENEVEGIVTALNANGFVVGDTTVTVSASTTYEGGTKDDVVVGVKVEAEGTIDASGVLAARKVKFKPYVRIEAKVEAKDEAAGTITVLGLKVNVTPSTEDATIGSLAVGQVIEVRGTMSRDGLSVNATRIQANGGNGDRAFLRGLVTAKTATTVSIAGIEANLSGAEFRNLSDGAMTLEQFLAAVTPGTTLVKVRWKPYPASLSESIDEAELEN